MLKIYLLRHGETQYNADGNRYCGRTDISLTEKGLQQASKVASQMKTHAVDAVYSSPLERASHTARIASGGKEPILDSRLIEVDFGQWEGKTREEFTFEDPESWANWMADPGETRAGLTGENALEVVKRVDAFYTEMRSKHPNGIIMVVGHNGINRLYMAYKLGMPLKNYRQLVQENSSLSLIELDANGEMTLMKLNSGS